MLWDTNCAINFIYHSVQHSSVDTGASSKFINQFSFSLRHWRKKENNKQYFRVFLVDCIKPIIEIEFWFHQAIELIARQIMIFWTRNHFPNKRRHKLRDTQNDRRQDVHGLVYEKQTKCILRWPHTDTHAHTKAIESNAIKTHWHLTNVSDKQTQQINWFDVLHIRLMQNTWTSKMCFTRYEASQLDAAFEILS